MLDLARRYYPHLVQEFYANIEDKDDAVVHRFVTHLKGCCIELDCAILAHILGVMNHMV